jgi:hypothetical protein
MTMDMTDMAAMIVYVYEERMLLNKINSYYNLKS